MLWFRRDTRKSGTKGGAESDAELVARLRNQDQQAFLRLYDGHAATIYRFLLHMTGLISVAEELTQDVFLEILNAMCSGAIRNFDPEKGTLEGYLLGIARNLARRELRRNRSLVSLESVLESPEWNWALDRVWQDNREWAGMALVIVRADIKALYRALLDLPDHYREVVVLCSLQEKSYQQAAALLHVSEGTIASRMNRARALLAAKLRKSQSQEVNT